MVVNNQGCKTVAEAILYDWTSGLEPTIWELTNQNKSNIVEKNKVKNTDE